MKYSYEKDIIHINAGSCYYQVKRPNSQGKTKAPTKVDSSKQDRMPVIKPNTNSTMPVLKPQDNSPMPVVKPKPDTVVDKRKETAPKT